MVIVNATTTTMATFMTKVMSRDMETVAATAAAITIVATAKSLATAGQGDGNNHGRAGYGRAPAAPRRRYVHRSGSPRGP